MPYCQARRKRATAVRLGRYLDVEITLVHEAGMVMPGLAVMCAAPRFPASGEGWLGRGRVGDVSGPRGARLRCHAGACRRPGWTGSSAGSSSVPMPAGAGFPISTPDPVPGQGPRAACRPQLRDPSPGRPPDRLGTFAPSPTRRPTPSSPNSPTPKGRYETRYPSLHRAGVGGRSRKHATDLQGEAPMPLTFRKSFRILPGVRLNINRHSWSITTGGGSHGPKHTHSSTGRRTTSVDLPGPFGWRRTRTTKRH